MVTELLIIITKLCVAIGQGLRTTIIDHNNSNMYL